MSHAVARSIFSGIDPSKLRHLRLNNVQTFAERPSDLQGLDEEEIEMHRRRTSGALQGYLVPWTGKCSALRSFHIMTTADFVGLNDGPLSAAAQQWPARMREEQSRYHEIAEFISSVRLTLRELIFEHGPDVDYFVRGPGRNTDIAFTGPNHDNPLPLDVYFDTHILPLFWLGTWPKLQTLAIRGIGHWKPLNPWREGATTEEQRWLHNKTKEFRERALAIWNSAGGSKISFAVEDESSRPLYRFQADKGRKQTGSLYG
jgi:hypothetical protein